MRSVRQAGSRPRRRRPSPAQNRRHRGAAWRSGGRAGRNRTARGARRRAGWPGGRGRRRTFDLVEVLAEDPDWVTTIDISRKVETLSGFLCGGEGSYGSAEFFARLDDQERLVWVCYLSEFNPIDTLTVVDG